MSKLAFKFLLVFALCISSLLGLAANVQAQEPVSTPTPALTQTPTSTSSNQNVVTFEQLQLGEVQLTGPYDTFGFTFAILC